MKIDADLVEWLRELSKSHFPKWEESDRQKAELLFEQIQKESDMNKAEVKALVLNLYDTTDRIKANDLKEIDCREKIVELEDDIRRLKLKIQADIKTAIGADGKPLFKNEMERNIELEDRLNQTDEYGFKSNAIAEYKKTAELASIESKHLLSLFNLGTLKYSFLTNNPDESFITNNSESLTPANALEKAKSDILNKKDQEDKDNDGKVEQSGPVGETNG